MIVKEQPSAMHLFVTMQGSIVPQILSKILGIALISILVMIIDGFFVALPHISISAIGIFGVALSLFLGFRNNAAYDRWWEARKLWGGMIADSRTLGRDARLFFPTDASRRSFMKMVPVFAHFHRGYLRETNVSSAVLVFAGEQKTQIFAAYTNPADAALRDMADQLADLTKKDAISGFCQFRMSQSLSSLALAQAGCERIASTPLPFVYSLLVRRTTYLYCWLLPFALIDSTSLFTPLFAAIVAYVFFGLQAVTNELEAPFANAQNGLPLDAMCRIIEMSVAEALGDPVPEPLKPQNYILT